MSGFVWYSFGSDETGPKLAEALGFDSGKKTPNPELYAVILSWGCKAGEKYNAAKFAQAVTSGGLRLLNTPEAVEAVRNKRHVLHLLQQRKVLVPGYLEQGQRSLPEFRLAALQALEAGTLSFPLVGQSEVHKGDPVFFHTTEEVANGSFLSEEDGVRYYIRSLCTGTEYRIHVLRDMAILAQVKVPAADPEVALKESLMSTLRKRATKLKKKLNPATEEGISFAVDALAPEMLRGSGQLLQSTGRGWTLQDCDLKQVPEHVIIEAINALDAAGLDIGAVSLTVDGKVARVTNVTSAPGLSEAHLPLYAAAIGEFCAAKPSKKKKTSAAAQEEGASPELQARLSRAVKGLPKARAEELLKSLEGS